MLFTTLEKDSGLREAPPIKSPSTEFNDEIDTALSADTLPPYEIAIFSSVLRIDFNSSLMSLVHFMYRI